MKSLTLLVGACLFSINAMAATHSCRVVKSLHDPNDYNKFVRSAETPRFPVGSLNEQTPYVLPFIEKSGNEWGKASVGTSRGAVDIAVAVHNYNEQGAVDHSIYMDFKTDVKHIADFSRRDTLENGMIMMFMLNCEMNP